ncbi:MAG: hypothetical protein VX899_19205 [Myxococcota bacterium]|nr:hypothetical protein [Myxococcota bacterium]
MSQDLAARTAGLEWAHRSAAGTLEALDWVDSSLDTQIAPYTQIQDEEGKRQFSHLPYAAFLPSLMTNAVIQAQADGEVTLQEALLLLMARSEWLIANRERLWSPLTPLPHLLATLVEAFGVDQDLHRDDPEILARLAAQLPQWYPSRGTVERAREVLESTEDLHQLEGVATADRDGTNPDGILNEAFVCHSSQWWEERSEKASAPAYRISGGVLKFQAEKAEHQYPLRREDILLRWDGERPLPRQLLRLLPTWVALRLVIPSESRP